MLLLSAQKEFAASAIIDEDNPAWCEEFAPVGEMELQARKELHKLLGPGYLRGLHVLPRQALEDIEEEDVSEVPDFTALITEGLTVEQRLEQLQYVTEDDGSFAVDEDGHMIPRGQLSVRKYASDPEGPLGQLEDPEVNTVAFLDFDKVLDRIIKAEKKLYGLGGRKPSAKKKAAVKAAITETAAPAAKEKKKMATKPRIMLRRNTGASASKKTTSTKTGDKTPDKVKAKVSKAATSKKKVASKKTAQPAEASAETTEAVVGIDMAAIEALVKNEVAEGLKPIEAKLDALLALVGEGPNGRSIAQTVTDATTAVHDALQQKVSNVFFGIMGAMSVDEDGEQVPYEDHFPFLEPDDGRDRMQNLLEGEEPMDVISFYLDGEADEGEEEGEE